VFTAAAAACVVTSGDTTDDTGGPSSDPSTSAGTSDPTACMEEHNVVVGDQCFCEEGYEFCEPNDPNDYSCCGSSGPNPSSTTPTTDTESSTTDVDPTDADTTQGESDTDGPTPPDPADCTVDSPEAIYCTNTAEMGPENSAYYTCTDGAWVENPSAADELCMFDGYDFAYGCIDDGSAVAFICGNGTGEACEDNDASMCISTDEIDTCIFGRSTQDSCAAICQTIGDEKGITYDSGFCDAEAKVAECICCDEGECP
jgi:hypothetical protein